MKKNIFRSILFVGLSVFIITFILSDVVLYRYFIGEQQKQQLDEAHLVGHALENEGNSYFDSLEDKDFRITWIDDKGNVLYDSDSNVDEMDNHLSRKEIKDALAKGEGQSKRYSKTLLYSAVRLQNGTILRLSSEYYTIWFIALLMIQPIMIICIFVTLLSVLCADYLSKKIVEPINSIDLEKPFATKTYKELNPFLLKIFVQQNQLKKQEKMLEKKSREFAAVTSNLDEGLILVNKDLNVLTTNKAAEKIFCNDYSFGLNINDFCKVDKISDLFDGKSFDYKTTNITINNKYYEVTCSSITSNNEITGYALLIIDETKKKMAEKIRKDFTTNVSHELKTPLQVISGYAELLKQEVVDEEDRNIFIDKIYSESHRMISLVNKIIYLSQLDGDDLYTNYEDVDLYECILSVIDSLKEEANSKNVKLLVDGESIKVKAVYQLLFGAIYNICENAIKYNKENGFVNINLKIVDNHAVLTIADTGVGIDEADKERVFERFYRVSKSRSKENGGTGLGLSIAKHTIERFMGSIEIESKIEKGTIIKVSLPIVE